MRTFDASRLQPRTRADCPFRAGRARPGAAHNDAAASSQPEHRTGDISGDPRRRRSWQRVTYSHLDPRTSEHRAEPRATTTLVVAGSRSSNIRTARRPRPSSGVMPDRALPQDGAHAACLPPSRRGAGHPEQVRCARARAARAANEGRSVPRTPGRLTYLPAWHFLELPWHFGDPRRTSRRGLDRRAAGRGRQSRGQLLRTVRVQRRQGRNLGVRRAVRESNTIRRRQWRTPGLRGGAGRDRLCSVARRELGVGSILTWGTTARRAR
jgi:hypothetical protein